MDCTSVLIVYCSRDEPWKQHVANWFDRVRGDRVQLELWGDAAWNPGDEFGDVVTALLLLTPAFLASAVIRGKILPRLLEWQGERRELVSLWLEDCAWPAIEGLSSSRLVAANGRPVAELAPVERAQVVVPQLARLVESVSEPPDDGSSDAHSLYRRLFDRHYRGVFYFFARRGFGTEECRDLAQETFLRVYRGLDAYRSEATAGTWIRAIVRNLWLNRIRDAKARKRQASEVSLEQAFKSGPVPEDRDVFGRQRWPDPEERVLDAELRGRLRAAIRALPPQARRCQLLQLDGLKYREIANVLGISIQAVRSHLFQARQRLEQELERGKPALTGRR